MRSFTEGLSDTRAEAKNLCHVMPNILQITPMRGQEIVPRKLGSAHKL